jgi:PleD family two-component response regulator
MILIVDDQKDTRTALERLLKYAGHQAVSVTGGAEALAMLHLRKPSLMILDVNMPEMDGLTVLRTIKGHEELKDVKVLMYSADTHDETMAEAKRLGAVDFLVKGTIAFDKLVARICELAGEKSKADSVGLDPPAPSISILPGRKPPRFPPTNGPGRMTGDVRIILL